MEQQIKNPAKEEFNKKLDVLSREALPALFNNNDGFVVIYEKLLEIEKKVENLKK